MVRGKVEREGSAGHVREGVWRAMGKKKGGRARLGVRERVGWAG